MIYIGPEKSWYILIRWLGVFEWFNEEHFKGWRLFLFPYLQNPMSYKRFHRVVVDKVKIIGG